MTLSEGRNMVVSTGIFRTKRDENGHIYRYRARGDAQDLAEALCIDFDETYAPVARLTSRRMFLTNVANYNLEWHHLDAETAYLNEQIDWEIFWRFPQGYKQSDPSTNCFKLNKGLYGLKQSGRLWYQQLDQHLCTIGFKRTASDWGIYRNGKTTNLVYVDDILVA